MSSDEQAWRRAAPSVHRLPGEAPGLIPRPIRPPGAGVERPAQSPDHPGAGSGIYRLSGRSRSPRWGKSSPPPIPTTMSFRVRAQDARNEPDDEQGSDHSRQRPPTSSQAVTDVGQGAQQKATAARAKNPYNIQGLGGVVRHQPRPRDIWVDDTCSRRCEGRGSLLGAQRQEGRSTPRAAPTDNGIPSAPPQVRRPSRGAIGSAAPPTREPLRTSRPSTLPGSIAAR